jgi:hypothetical protein
MGAPPVMKGRRRLGGASVSEGASPPARPHGCAGTDRKPGGNLRQCPVSPLFRALTQLPPRVVSKETSPHKNCMPDAPPGLEYQLPVFRDSNTLYEKDNLSGTVVPWRHFRSRARPLLKAPGPSNLRRGGTKAVNRLTGGVIWTEFTSRQAGPEGIHTGMSLKDEWDRLDSETRTWLVENPGCLVLPSIMSAKISKEAQEDFERDPHGQVVLSRADHDFIREKAEAAGTIRVPATDYQFFDTAAVPVIRTATSGRHAAASPDEDQQDQSI